MTMLTGLVLVVALGAIAHYSGAVSANAGGSGRYSPVDDVASVEAGGEYAIDVVANDKGVREGDGDRVLIVSSPSCGFVRRENGVIRYSADSYCRGPQKVTYCVARGDDCETAVLTLDVRPPRLAVADEGRSAATN